MDWYILIKKYHEDIIELEKINYLMGCEDKIAFKLWIFMELGKGIQASHRL